LTEAGDLCYFRSLAKIQQGITMQADRTPFSTNISKYLVYTIFKGFHFGLITAIWVIFMQELHGVTLTQVTVLDVVFWIAATLGEVPTGIVADSYGRKASLAMGTGIMAVSVLAWTFAPTLPLIMASYAALAIGVTFLSGAEDAFFFESLKMAGRIGDYPRLAGRMSAFSLAAVAAGNVSSGLLASIDLRLPLLMAALSLLVMLGLVLTFKEPQSDAEGTEGRRSAYSEILKSALSIMRARPALRYALLYWTLVPITSMAIETVFLQPQAIALGVPLAAIGFVGIAVQIAKMAGSAWSHRVKEAIGESKIIGAVPFAIAASLILLGLFQVLPALGFAAAISLFTAVLRPLVMNRILNDVTDNIRATVLSVQALLFAFTVALIEPLLGYIADQSGLPTMYYSLAGGVSLLALLLFWRSRSRFP
jgi:MFS family permease